jgi:hypothetical protein
VQDVDEATIETGDKPKRGFTEEKQIATISVGVQVIFKQQVLVKCYFDGDPSGGFYWFKIADRPILYGGTFKLYNSVTWNSDVELCLMGQLEPIDMYQFTDTGQIGQWVSYTCCDLEPSCGDSSLDTINAAETPTPCP